MLRRIRWTQLLCASLALPLLATGCFRRGPELAAVTGTVTLDGEPLANAQVEFQPTRRGSPSYGTTNSLGQYALEYTKDKPGAAVGTHVVRITAETTVIDKAGNEVQIPQRVPDIYNYRSELLEQVKPGENKFDFHLESEPEPEEPLAVEPKIEKPGEKEPKVEGPGTKMPKAKAPAAEEETGAKAPQAQEAEAEAPEAQEAEAEKPAKEQPERRETEAGES